MNIIANFKGFLCITLVTILLSSCFWPPKRKRKSNSIDAEFCTLVIPSIDLMKSQLKENFYFYI